jgi:hypothetical protein
LTDEELIVYLAHSRVTEQRASEQVAQMLDCLGDDPELGRGLAIVADDEVSHLSYCHEELLRLCASGHDAFIRRTLVAYAHAEIRVNRDVSLTFVRDMARIFGWPGWKRALLAFGAWTIWAYERLWGWRRLARLAPPLRVDALGGQSQPAMVA